jgi:hypothetical protein
VRAAAALMLDEASAWVEALAIARARGWRLATKSEQGHLYLWIDGTAYGPFVEDRED